MKLRLSHLVRFTYAQEVAFSPHRLLLRPRDSLYQRTLRFQLNVSPSAQLSPGHDVFDNTCYWANFWDRAADLNIRTEVEVETNEFNPFDFILRTEAVRFPFAYSPVEQLALSSYLASPFDPFQPAIRAWLDEHFVDRPTETIPYLTALNTLLYYTLAFDASAPSATPAEVLQRGVGASTSFATALTALARSLGLAARLVSGYLATYPGDNRVCPHSNHVWTEIYLPGAGWKGLDATHGIFCTGAYVPVAHGPDLASICAVQGSYYASSPVLSQATTRVRVETLSP